MEAYSDVRDDPSVLCLGLVQILCDGSGVCDAGHDQSLKALVDYGGRD